MANISGNVIGSMQANTVAKNAIGEAEKTWKTVFNHYGWLDLQSCDSKYSTHKAKIEESTHVFLCDYHSGIYALTIPDSKTKAVPDVRMIIKGMVYDVLLIDNPMEMGSGSQLEFYLKFTGGQ